MKITELFLYKPIFMFELLIAMHLFSFRLPKKKHYALRLVLTTLCCLALSLVFPLFERFSYSWWFSSFMFLLFYLAAFLSLFFVYDVSKRKLFFISIASYTTQHLSHEIYALTVRLLNLTDSPSLGFYGDKEILTFDLGVEALQVMGYLEIHLLVYLFVYFVFRKKVNDEEIHFDNFSLLIIAALILFTSIILSSVITYLNADYNKIYFIIVDIYNLLSCFMILYIQFYVIDNRRLKSELHFTSELLHQSEVRYEESKKNVNLINLKCHDLKHQIRTLSKQDVISKDTVQEIANIINIYDQNVATGNEVLDIILSEKGLLCQKENIKLSVMADCSKLSFVLDADLYCLFGNALDNAIEAVQKIKNPKKRQINLIVKSVHSLVSISIENYFEGTIKFDKNGLPITIKKDKSYHGFGMKSIKMVVEKYQGDMKLLTRGDIFSLNILFPSKQVER